MSVEAAKPKAVNRAAAVRPAAAPLRVQTFSNRVSSPKDPAEREAEATAKKIMRMPVQAMRSPYIARFAETGVARQGAGQPEVTSGVAAGIQSGMAGGSPLPPSVRGFMEPRFRADFSSVKVHTGEHAARLSRQLNAQAFTVGNHVFFGRDKFRPESDQGKELIAHELTHTIQQGSVIQRSEDATVTQTSPVQVQRFGLDSVLNFFADWANAIPGFRMFTIVIGFNPINMSAVDRSPANILRAVVEFMPGGILITKALDNYGIFDRVGTWVEQQLRSLRSIGSTIRQGLLDLITPSSFLNPRGAWNKAERLFSEAIARIKSFLTGLADSILKFIKDAILRPLAQLASQTSGWDLLKAVLGRDPITGDPVPQDAAALIGGFMKLIGQQEVYDNLKKSNALGRAAAWFRSALGELLAFVRELPSLFLQALKDLTITDIVLLPMAFVKVGRVFGSFAGRFISWALSKVLSLLEIIFDVLAPSVMPYLRKAAGAFKTIIQNPIGFVGNLVKAAMLGFRNFASNIGEHLKAALIDWLTGSLPGVYIPKSFELGELVKFVLSVLGISWQNVRAKLVKVIGETAVGVLEKGFDVVVTLVKDGPAAAWDKIKEHLANLRDMVINGIVDMVIDMVAKRAVPKIVAMFIPGAGFLSAILSIVDTVQVFVSKLSRIAQVVASFIDSIASIASGAVAGAAKRVESTLAGLLSLAISFLAGFAGLGKVSDKIMGVINKVRAPTDKALDRLIDWIVAMAKKLGRLLVGADSRDATTDPNTRLAQALAAVNESFAGTQKGVKREPLTRRLEEIRSRFRLRTLEARLDSGGLLIVAELNPRKEELKQLRVLRMAASTPKARLVENAADLLLERGVADVIDNAQEVMNDLYRAGGSLGDKSTAFAIMAEQARGGPGQAARPFFYKNVKIKKRKRNPDGTYAMTPQGQPVYDRDERGKVLYEVDESGNIKRELRAILHFDKVDQYLLSLNRKIEGLSALKSRRADILVEVQSRLSQEIAKLVEAREWAAQFKAGSNPRLPKWAVPFEGQLRGPDIIEDEA